ncbi:hypothetical protein GGP41_002505 [Bipolaris sorokiniana]|uniref:Uncharacterized protein n=1 Tax=Cochliobolus sativus TaxID=45130 RepID=A0A8H6DXN0_COCSA|nr:hypothetical protein GGP41_002505 [Bipolaris sorokiniana]
MPADRQLLLHQHTCYTEHFWGLVSIRGSHKSQLGHRCCCLGGCSASLTRAAFAPPLLIKNVAEDQVRNVIDCVVCWSSWICHSQRYESSARFDGHGPLNPW